MATKKENFTKSYLKTNLPDLKPGDIIKVYQKVTAYADPSKKKSTAKKEGERIQVFEGIIIALKHGKGISGTMTVRKMSGGIGVERIFPLHCPAIEKVEVVSHSKVRRAKLYYLRDRVGKKAKLKRVSSKTVVPETKAAEGIE